MLISPNEQEMLKINQMYGCLDKTILSVKPSSHNPIFVNLLSLVYASLAPNAFKIGPGGLALAP